MRRTRLGLLITVLLVGCATPPGHPVGGGFALGQWAQEPDPEFTDASGQTYSLRALGARGLLVRYAPAVRGVRVPPGGFRARRLPNGTEVFRFDSPEAAGTALKALLGDPDVELAEADAPFSLAGALGAAPSDPLIASQSYLAANEANASAAWALEAGDPAGSYVAVLDSGIDTDHPEFTSNQVASSGLDFLTDPPGPSNEDVLGHGTNVAGVIAAAANGAGIVGVAPQARVLHLKITDTKTFDTGTLVRALYAAANDPNVGVINLSLAGRTDLVTLREAIDHAVWNRKVVVAAAGNEASNGRTFPASYAGVLAVGASRRSGTSLLKTSFSNFGPWIGIVAPGQALITTTLGGTYGPVSGTSLAAPVVSGAALLLRTLRPTWSSEQIRTHLRNYGGALTTDFGAASTRHLNVQQALAAAAAPVDTGPAVVAGSVKIAPAANAFNGVDISWRLDKEPVAPQVNASAPVVGSDLLFATLNNDAACLVATGTVSTSPIVRLRGLQHGTRYNVILKGVDEAGNQPTNSSIVYSFTTRALTIDSPQFASSVHTPVLRWRTNAPTAHTVYVSPNADMSASSALANSRLDAQHSVAMPRLKPDTVYHYRVVCTDAHGNTVTTTLQNRTLAITVSTPVIQSGPTGHHVSWTSNVPTLSELWWGDLAGVSATATCDPAATCAIASNSLDLTTIHSVRLDVPRADIHVKPVVRDDAATPAVVHGKPTPARGPKPRFSEFAATDVKATEAILSWRTDATVLADVAATTSTTAPAAGDYVAATPASGTLFRAHLTGLTPNATHQVYLRLTPISPAGLLGTPTIVRPGVVVTRP